MTVRTARRAGLMLTVAIMAGCAEPKAPSGTTNAEALASLRASDSTLQLAVAALDAERAVELYAEDAVVMPVAEPLIEGRAAIRAYWEHVFGIPGFTNSSRLVALETSSDGTMGYTRGTYESPMAGIDGARVIERGKWVSLWKRQRNGDWRIAVDIFNTDSVPPDHQESTAEPHNP